MSFYEPTDADIAVAGRVLRAIKQVDPYFVNANLDTARGWARILGPTDYSEQEMLAGVLDYYTHEANGRHCMPANVIAGAKRAREQLARTPEGRAALEQHRQRRRDELDARIEAAKQQRELEQRQYEANAGARAREAQEIKQKLLEGLKNGD